MYLHEDELLGGTGAITFAQEKESAMAILQFVARNRGSAGARSYDNSVSILQAEETGPPEIAALTQTNYRTHKPRGSSRIPDGYMRPNRFEALGRNFRQWPGNRRM